MLIVSLILLQVIIFAALIMVFRGILNKNVVQATQHLDELNEDYSRKEKEADRLLKEAQQKYDALMAKVREDAEKEKERIVKGAEAERDKMINQARVQGEEMIRQADKARQLLIQELEERIAKGAVEKACELIQNTLPDKFRQDVHSEWTEELITDSLDELKHLQIPEGINEAVVTSAFPLNDEQRKNLFKKLKQLLDRDVELTEKTDPKIVAGIVVSIGNLVLDGSLKNKIKEQARVTGYGERGTVNGG